MLSGEDQSVGELSELLLRNGKVDHGGLERAGALAAVSGERLDVVLTRLGLVSESDMAAALAEQLALPLAGLGDYPERPLLGERVSIRFLRASRVLPLREHAGHLDLAMADPLDSYAREAIRLLAGKEVRPVVAVPAELDAALDRLFGKPKPAAEIAAASLTGEGVASADIERLRDLASEAPVIRLVNGLISRAVNERASDIHIEPFEGTLRLRYRIDGVLRAVEAPPSRLQAAIASRVKIMAGLDIAERRLAQDGRIKANVQGREIDLRVSTVPTQHGESVVLRILDQSRAPLDLGRLGFSTPVGATLSSLLERPNGIILVTGPTGSGKTTTLYAALQRLNDPSRKLITVEDPVEYELPGINQIQVRPRIGLTFATVLRAILRQDPDIIMVGEIRDGETARIAVQAALTGHLVLSTLHTNDAAGALTRLVDMGVENYLLTSSVLAVLAQRLVRRLCLDCRERYRPAPELVRQLGLERLSEGGEPWLHRARGCVACQGSGFAGRTTIAELMPLEDDLRRLVLRRAERRELDQAARAAGMRPMADDGLLKALAGITTIEEVMRVTQVV
ncbi:MAG: type II secretion system ATPase GspE [Alphaproteobacteria bacterium]|nr:type II secretion system ATPase GspE [Alphaproteobacteria bacterium]